MLNNLSIGDDNKNFIIQRLDKHVSGVMVIPLN